MKLIKKKEGVGCNAVATVFSQSYTVVVAPDLEVSQTEARRQRYILLPGCHEMRTEAV